MQKLTIASISRGLVKTKYGEKTSVRVQCSEYPGQMISGFENDDTKNWAIGQVVEVEAVKENGKYLNFFMPKKQWGGGGDLALAKKVNDLIADVNALKTEVAKIKEFMLGK